MSSIDLSKWLAKQQIDWVIAGGESGGQARPTHPNWIRSLRDQCRDNGVPFHFKQWGHWSPERESVERPRKIELEDESGTTELLTWKPKKLSGRLLDGRTWDGYPQTQ